MHKTSYIFAFEVGRNPLPFRLREGGLAAAGGGVPTVQTFAQDTSRYRLQVFVQVQNLTNRANYAGYSGTLTSPFFGRPTTVAGTRKVDVGLNLSF